MAGNKDEGISEEVVDQLLPGRDPSTVVEGGGRIDELKKRLAERMLNAEMDHHLGSGTEQEAGNHRNGYGSKNVITDTGKLELSMMGRYFWPWAAMLHFRAAITGGSGFRNYR